LTDEVEDVDDEDDEDNGKRHKLFSISFLLIIILLLFSLVKLEHVVDVDSSVVDKMDEKTDLFDFVDDDKDVDNLVVTTVSSLIILDSFCDKIGACFLLGILNLSWLSLILTTGS